MCNSSLWTSRPDPYNPNRTRDLNAVAPFAEKPLDTYLASVTDEVLVERWLERMICRMIDINYHLITEAGQPPPRDYYESFVERDAAHRRP